MKKEVFGIAAALLPTMTLAGCAVVGPGEVGIKQEFGKVEKNLYESGLQSYNPFTQKFIVQSVQKQTVKSEEANNSLSTNPSTSDQLPIKIEYAVIYQVPKNQVLPLYLSVKGDPFESLVAPRVNEAVRMVVSQYKSDEVTSKSEEMQQRIAQLANKLVGDPVTIVDVPITHIELPAAIRAAVTDKQNMEVQARKKQFELQKERIQAEITVVDAKAKAESIKVQSQALKQSPELVKLKMAEVELEKARRWDGHLPTTMVGDRSLFLMK